MAVSEEAKLKKISDWKLAFNSRRFHKGLNITFRDGNDKYTEMNPGDTMLMVDRFGSVIGNGRILAKEVFNINKWPYQVEFLLRFEPNFEIRTLEDLKKNFNDVYGEKNWGPVVTAVLFWVV